MALLLSSKKRPPAMALIVRRKTYGICYRRVHSVIKTHQVGNYRVVIAKVYDEFMLLEYDTGLFLGKGAKLAEALAKLPLQTAGKLKSKLEELPRLLNDLKRRTYEIA